MTDALSGGVAIRAAYLLVFGGSALVCFAGLRRTDRIAHDDTRRGLRWLLLTSGAWGLAHVGYLVAPTPGLAYALFVAGLVVGMAAVGPWLYFCSAYTGRSLHKNAGIRRFAVGTFLAVVLLKVTNPIHGAYFAAEAVAEPFAYLAIEHGPLHWAAMGLAYALSFVGFFALFELFLRVNSDTRPLFALVGLTGLPVVLDVLGAVSPRLLNVTHSPLGVAAFAVGVLFVHLDRFRIARAAGEGDDPVIVLDDTDRVRDYNAGAVELLPSLAGRVGAAFDEVLPEIDAALEEPDPVVELDRDGTTRYYTISSGAFSMDRARTGRTIILTDVTDRERYRQRLERQNEQLERFASIVSHDLRNPLSVARGWTELAIEEEDTRELGNVVDAHNRMGEIIEEILTLAREGNPIDEREDVHLAAVADRS